MAGKFSCPMAVIKVVLLFVVVGITTSVADGASNIFNSTASKRDVGNIKDPTPPDISHSNVNLSRRFHNHADFKDARLLDDVCGDEKSFDTELACILEMVDTEYANSMDPTNSDQGQDDVNERNEVFFVCRSLMDNAMRSYQIELPTEVVAAYHNFVVRGNRPTHHQFAVNVTSVCLNTNQDEVVLSDQSQFQKPWTYKPKKQRQMVDAGDRKLQEAIRPHPNLVQTVGTRFMVVLRVTYLSHQPSLTASELRGRIFGEGDDAVDVHPNSQLMACSSGQLGVQAFEAGGIVNGITEIHIAEPVVFGDDPIRKLENAALELAELAIDAPLRDIDHILIALPNADDIIAGHGYLAYAYIFGSVSVYNDHWAGYFSVLAHELGHNIGLHHSGWGKSEYADTSGLMGYSWNKIGFPEACFNGQKNYLLGWFQSRTRRLDTADLPWTGNLAWFGDYELTEKNQHVLIYFARKRYRLFISFNRASGMNAGNAFRPNRVVVVRDRAVPGDRSAVRSLYRGQIPSRGGDHLRVNNLDIEHDLIIYVCHRVRIRPLHLRLSIYLDDGIQGPNCSDSAVSNYCDDDFTKEFYVDGLGYRDCAWLQRHPPRKERFCDTSEAHNVCPETCEKCSDSCEDSLNYFYVHEDDFRGTISCNWLSSHPYWKDRFCYNGNAAFSHCHETCDRCD